MLAATSTVVKLSDDQQVVISDAGIELQDARSYTPRLIAAMNLEDAIVLAQAVLALREQEDAELERMYQYELDRADARADALSAHWGHD